MAHGKASDFCAPGDPAQVFNWRRLDNRLTTSGQPTEDQLPDIRKLGVSRIINLGLHTHEKALRDERASVEALGMIYTHIPVEFGSPTDSDFKKFVEVMETSKDEVVHVHCIVNARVSAFMHRYLRDVSQDLRLHTARIMESIWRPGEQWAAFLGDKERLSAPIIYAGRDY